MKQIVIEVDNKLAKVWKDASEQTKKIIGNKINISLARELITNPQNGYVDFLINLRAEMKQKGLTQEKLDDILNS